jgi:hypothetical protein
MTEYDTDPPNSKFDGGLEFTRRKILTADDPTKAAKEEVNDIREEFNSMNEYVERNLGSATDREIIFITERNLMNIKRLKLINEMMGLGIDDSVGVVEGVTEDELDEMERLTKGEITRGDVDRMKEIWR